VHEEVARAFRGSRELHVGLSVTWCLLRRRGMALSMFVPPALERSTGHMCLPVRLPVRGLLSVTPMTDVTHASMTRPSSGMVRHHNDRRIWSTLAAGMKRGFGSARAHIGNGALPDAHLALCFPRLAGLFEFDPDANRFLDSTGRRPLFQLPPRGPFGELRRALPSANRIFARPVADADVRPRPRRVRAGRSGRGC
jgi:hypothetical protein